METEDGDRGRGQRKGTEDGDRGRGQRTETEDGVRRNVQEISVTYEC